MNIKYWWYRKRWDWAAFWLPRFPLHLDIELTSRCNLQCNMCPHSEQPKKFPIGDMDWEMIWNVLHQGAGWTKIDEIVEFKKGDAGYKNILLRRRSNDKRAYAVKFNWRGEPTLYKRLPNAINLAKALGYVDIMLNTNGNYPIELNNRLKNLTTCIFSVDSIDPCKYEEIRKGGDLSLVLANMRGLRYLAPKIRIIAQMRLQQLNKSESESFRAYFEGRGFEVQISPAMQRTEKGDYTLGDLKAIGRKDCLMPRRRLLIDWQGDIYPCCCDWYGKIKDGFQQREKMPNINKQTLEGIWVCSLKLLRHHLKTKKVFDIEPCKSCFSRESYIWKK